MVTVATKIEAPAKFLFVAANRPEGSYPFSVLGLGDLVVPGSFVSLMRNFDLDQAAAAAAQTATVPPRWGRRSKRRSARAQDTPMGGLTGPYFTSAMLAYAAGLSVTFAANYLTKAGQPALVYIVPSLLAAALITAFSRGEVQQLLDYRSARAEAAALRVREEAEATKGGT